MKTVCVIGDRNSGKTTLIERLVPALGERGRVATVKSIRTNIDVDEEGKDTYRHRQAGAERVVGLTPGDRFEVADSGGKGEVSQVLDSLAGDGYDYAVLEGFSETPLPKIAVGEPEDGVENVVLADGSDASTEELVECIESLEDSETLGSLIRRVKRTEDSPKAGAVSTFTGRVRAENVDEGRTTHLEYEKYEGVADERMAEISDDLEAREGVYAVAMHHKTGVVRAEEDAVHVVVLAGHREEAFRAVEDGINRLKDEVPIFKKEVTEDGDFWVHDRP